MTAPVLMNAVHIAWISLLRDEQITPLNIETAPLRLLADIMEAAARGEEDAGRGCPRTPRMNDQQNVNGPRAVYIAHARSSTTVSSSDTRIDPSTPNRLEKRKNTSSTL